MPVAVYVPCETVRIVVAGKPAVETHIEVAETIDTVTAAVEPYLVRSIDELRLLRDQMTEDVQGEELHLPLFGVLVDLADEVGAFGDRPGPGGVSLPAAFLEDVADLVVAGDLLRLDLVILLGPDRFDALLLEVLSSFAGQPDSTPASFRGIHRDLLAQASKGTCEKGLRAHKGYGLKPVLQGDGKEGVVV